MLDIIQIKFTCLKSEIYQCKAPTRHVFTFLLTLKASNSNIILSRFVLKKMLLFRELIENTIAPKHQKISSNEHTQLVQLLVSKDNELKSVLQLAAEQAKIEQKMNALKAQVDIQVGTKCVLFLIKQY